ncbi:hypothetical protein BDZ97DRAFT_1760600 [Flammula alnicola]|nr:hypothetical protein BDZ97DRAFT_1760600 [Flammula alnicola]
MSDDNRVEESRPVRCPVDTSAMIELRVIRNSWASKAVDPCVSGVAFPFTSKMLNAYDRPPNTLRGWEEGSRGNTDKDLYGARPQKKRESKFYTFRRSDEERGLDDTSGWKWIMLAEVKIFRRKSSWNRCKDAWSVEGGKRRIPIVCDELKGDTCAFPRLKNPENLQLATFLVSNLNGYFAYWKNIHEYKDFHSYNAGI